MGSIAASRSEIVPAELVRALNNIPPFPTVALQALGLLSGTDTCLSELCSLIRRDPVFTGEILRIANSPLVAFSKEVTSVVQASMLLGFRRLRRVVMTVGFRSYLERPYTPALRACWRHGVACAMVAERTARWNSIDADLAYTAGILHDIGRVALLTIGPKLHSALIETAAAEPVSDTFQGERDSFGIDHCRAGRLLATTWELPEVFLDVTSRHHEPLTRQTDVNEMIRLGCRLAETLGFSETQNKSVRQFDEVLAEFPETVRKRLPGANQLADEIGKEIGVIEAGNCSLS